MTLLNLLTTIRMLTKISVSRQEAETLITRYASSDFLEDLAFSSSLGKEERAVIHKTARKYGLKSQSFGKGENRFLVVMRTPAQKLQMLKEK